MSNMWIHEALNSFQSGMSCYVVDPVSLARLRIGRVVDAGFTMDSDMVEQNHVVRGKRKRSQRRNISDTATLRFTCLEDLNPDVQRLAFGEQGIDETIEQDETVRKINEALGLYGTNLYEFAPFSAVSYDRLYAATMVSAVGVATGGSGWATAQVYFWVQPYWGTAPTPTTTIDALDLTYTAGPPSDISAVSAGYQGYLSTGDTTATRTITVTWTAPTSGPTPDGYIVYTHTADLLSAAVAAAVVSTPGVLTVAIGAKPAGDAYEAAQGLAVRSVTWDDSGVTYGSKILLNTETLLVWDSALASLRRGTSSSIAEGAHLEATYWCIDAASVAEKLGARGSAPILRGVYFEQWEPEVGGDDDWARPEGQMLYFPRVDFATSSPDLAFSELDFSAGMVFELEVNFDPTVGDFATRTIGSPKFASFTKRQP